MPPNISANNNTTEDNNITMATTEERIPLKSGNGYGSLSRKDDDTNKSPNPGSANNSRKSAYSRRRSESGDNYASKASHVLMKTQTSMLEDARTFAEGSIPHSMALGTVIGIVCGVASFVYYAILFWILEFVWNDLPQMIVVDKWPEWAYPLWIPLVGFTMAIGVGVTVIYMGEPGDLPYTIKCVHDDAYVAMSHVMPMVCASQFSIIGGGSLGPEAPLVAICAALGGFISRKVFKVSERNLVRKHTLMGMAGALAAFFGCPLGGSLFALEVNSRFGVEYFEHTAEALFSGCICLAVFRQLANLPIESIWEISLPKMENTSALDVCYGIFLGLIGALVAVVFANLHWKVMELFQKLDLLRNERAIWRGLFGSIVVVGLGLLVPHTMFWGEFEFQTISTMSAASTLDHIWPTYGLTRFEMDSWWTALIVGLAKMVAISFTVAGGYRGGFIFPLMATGAAFGRVIYYFFPFIPVQLCCLCMAGAINVGITRTAIATTLILSYLAGEQNSIAPILAASLVSLFATGYMPFIKSQVLRSDIDVLYDEASDDEEWDSNHPLHPEGPFFSMPKPENAHHHKVPSQITTEQQNVV
ncbi:transport protein YfeO [Seminavis robusta]|uniref:Transport protein YfeO n=1 Tax=Seminavis robusta TaxID=568900 RepID=A0A9N8DUT4_9STRA|nr:transport protein YfeO [Seminavis robusta]|eukprot:Sro307_g113350.1 transport protein YfeO (588) ;mRNA; r:50479-52476